jgi:hypothetical protein
LLNIRYHARCVRVGLAPQAFGTQGFGVFSQTLDYQNATQFRLINAFSGLAVDPKNGV